MTMLDDIYVSNIVAAIDGGIHANAVAGYVAGSWPTYVSLSQTYPNLPALSISPFATVDADCLDVENGDATIAQCPSWFQAQKARGSNFIVFYTSVSNVNSLVGTLSAAGIARSEYYLWTAHYTSEHLCTSACWPGLVTQADATQWESTNTYDQSLLSATFLTELEVARGIIPNPNPTPSPSPNPPSDLASETNMVCYDPVSGGFWTVNPVGAVYSYNGAPYLGGLNNPDHASWNAGYGKAVGPAVGISFYGLPNAAAADKGYVIVCQSATNPAAEPAVYRFPYNGSEAK